MRSALSYSLICLYRPDLVVSADIQYSGTIPWLNIQTVTYCTAIIRARIMRLLKQASLFLIRHGAMRTAADGMNHTSDTFDPNLSIMAFPDLLLPRSWSEQCLNHARSADMVWYVSARTSILELEFMFDQVREYTPVKLPRFLIAACRDEPFYRVEFNTSGTYVPCIVRIIIAGASASAYGHALTRGSMSAYYMEYATAGTKQPGGPMMPPAYAHGSLDSADSLRIYNHVRTRGARSMGTEAARILPTTAWHPLVDVTQCDPHIGPSH